MAKKKAPAAALMESKKLQSKGKEQKLGKAPDMAEEDPKLGKGMKAMFGKMAPGKGEKKEMPKKAPSKKKAK